MIAAQYPALLRASTGLEVLHSVVSGDLSSYSSVSDSFDSVNGGCVVVENLGLRNSKGMINYNLADDPLAAARKVHPPIGQTPQPFTLL